MRRIKQAKPSPTLLVAVIALVAALGGRAVAGVTVSKLNKKEKEQVKKISKRVSKKSGLSKTERRKARRIATNKAEKAVAGIPAGPKGDPGGQGPKGDTGPAGSTSCPSGTTRLGDTAVCYETVESGPSDQGIAAATCASRDRWLPPASVALMISEAVLVGTPLWAESSYYDGTDILGVTGGAGSGITHNETSAAYRCITYASDQ